MTEERDAAPQPGEANVPEPDRYYAEVVTPPAGTEGVSVATLQEAMNAGSQASWRLVGVVNEPGGRGLILVWDQQGFISG